MLLKACGDYLLRVRWLLIGFCIVASAVTAVSASDSNAANSENVVGTPILIETPAQNYGQPTLEDYRTCNENLKKCLSECRESLDAKTSCSTKCPICPILVAKDVVVQGINDTDYVAPIIVPALKASKVVRVTNEIHNVIDANTGNVTVSKESNIQVDPNSSHTGGDYGLGFNGNGPCCLVIRVSKYCRANYVHSEHRCTHKKHRVCGLKCKSKVMYAKQITRCTDDENGIENCQQEIIYKPLRNKRHAAHRCQYMPMWPFVNCVEATSHSSHGRCHKCFQLPYSYILRIGIPESCINCFESLHTPMIPKYGAAWQVPVFYPEMYQPYTPHIAPPYDYSDTENDKDSKPDGSDRGSGDDSIIGLNNEIRNEVILHELESDDPEHAEYAYDDDFISDRDYERRRRQIFRPSKYSLRRRKTEEKNIWS